ncbi:hypothetical protein HDU91_004347, partial [Kappamyces sp. JEL0680]
EAMRGYGATLVECEPTLTAREATLQAVVATTGAFVVPPYNHPLTITGQGTAMLEFHHQVLELCSEPLDLVLIPIGGGGLMSGSCIAGHALHPGLRIIGVEPLACNDAQQSLLAGTLIPAPEQITTLADGLKTSMGDLTWPIIRDHVEQVVAVTEAEIKEATHFVFTRCKLVAEPSSCAVVAALLFHHSAFVRPDTKRIGMVLTGGNIDLDVAALFP